MILLKNAVKNYNDFQLNISMEIPNGRISGLVGKNGAGKSTTIKLILGLVKPDSGNVSLFGTESSQLDSKEKEQIGVSLADAGFSSQLAISDIECILEKMYSNFDKAYFRKMCQKLMLPKDKIIKEFSTGMKAKLRALVALTHKAKLLIMDEPTAGLDVEARNEILDVLRNYVAEDDDRTILITSHISSDLEGLCDDIFLIHDGKIVIHEDTDVILEQYGVLKLNDTQYAKIDKSNILKSKKEPYGYACFTSNKRYYQKNYPDIVIEKGGIDELILMMTGGYR